VRLKKNKELPIRGPNISTFFGFPKYRRSAILSYLNNDSPQIENRPNKKIKVKKIKGGVWEWGIFKKEQVRDCQESSLRFKEYLFRCP
jgi:hypothetical protein